MKSADGMRDMATQTTFDASEETKKAEQTSKAVERLQERCRLLEET